MCLLRLECEAIARRRFEKFNVEELSGTMVYKEDYNNNSLNLVSLLSDAYLSDVISSPSGLEVKGAQDSGVRVLSGLRGVAANGDKPVADCDLFSVSSSNEVIDCAQLLRQSCYFNVDHCPVVVLSSLSLMPSSNFMSYVQARDIVIPFLRFRPKF